MTARPLYPCSRQLRRSSVASRWAKNRHVDLKSIEVPEKTARLQDALLHLLPGNDMKVVAHVQPRQTTAEMAAGLKKILAEEKPALILWQLGTAHLAP
jgi:hypothetical protein